jgi:hypothetical protein
MGQGVRLTTKPPRKSVVVIAKDDEQVLRGALEFAGSGEDVPIALEDIRALQIDLAQRRTIPTEGIR